ncbi:hypothetical protein TNCV_3540641 [Trichonephila clavipes]|nr:hypothetical protein TNCV_3540641 [Trichonephila clavipes]
MTNKKLVMDQIDHIKDSLKSIGKPLVRKVRGVDHGRVTPHGRSPEINVKLIVLRRKPNFKTVQDVRRDPDKDLIIRTGKRHAPEQRQGVKRSIPSSISSRTYKFKRPNTSSPGVESITGPSKLPDRRTATTTSGSRMEVSGRDNQTRQTRATTRRHNEQAEKPVRSNQTNTRRPCPYYLRSRIQEKTEYEDLNNNEINGIPGSTFRRRSLSMEALNGDPVHRI